MRKNKGFTLMSLPFPSHEGKRSRQGFTLMSLPFPSHEGKRSRQGFTLIELMIAISIVAVLATIGFTSFSQSQLRARDAKRKQDLRAVSVALELFYQKNQRYPCAGSTGWTYSTGTDWLVDKQDATRCPTGTNTNLTPFYISAMPTDPSGGTAMYGYYNGAINPYGTCTNTTSYMLTATLENANDPETITNKTTRACGTVLTTAGGWNANTFAISSD